MVKVVRTELEQTQIALGWQVYVRSTLHTFYLHCDLRINSTNTSDKGVRAHDRTLKELVQENFAYLSAFKMTRPK